MWRIPKITNKATALKAYHGYVASNLRYGILLWGNSVSINKAFVAQKRCIRAICNVSTETSCKPLFNELQLLTLPSIYIQEVSLFVKSHMHLFKKKKDQVNFNFRYPNRLILPLSRTVARSKNMYHMCIKIYNNLPNDLKNLTLSRFKGQLQKWLIKNCFCSVQEYLNNKT